MSRHTVMAAGIAVVGVTAGMVFLVRPIDRRTEATYREAADLMPLIATAPVQHARLHDLGRALDELSAHVREVCRPTPLEGGSGDAIDALWGGAASGDLRRRAIRPAERARAADDDSVAPLTIEMEGSFDAVFECLRRAEALAGAGGVTSVAMRVIESGADDRAPVLAATFDVDMPRPRGGGEASR